MQLDHIDITFDVETCSLAMNAAVMQVGAVAWVRGASGVRSLFPEELPPFEAKVDLRSCVMDGFDFDQGTLKWWADRPKELRESIACGECYPIEDVIRHFGFWIGDIKADTGARTVALWAQGSDFDIAVLKHICRKYDIPVPVYFQFFRDARTFILEVAAIAMKMPCVPADTDEIYRALPPMPEDGVGGMPHHALYDAMRTSWDVNTCFSLIKPSH